MAETPDRNPIVDEFRKIRDDLAREFNYDARKLGEYLRQRQRDSQSEYFSGAPRSPRTDLMHRRDADAA